MELPNLSYHALSLSLNCSPMAFDSIACMKYLDMSSAKSSALFSISIRLLTKLSYMESNDIPVRPS